MIAEAAPAMVRGGASCDAVATVAATSRAELSRVEPTLAKATAEVTAADADEMAHGECLLRCGSDGGGNVSSQSKPS